MKKHWKLGSFISWAAVVLILFLLFEMFTNSMNQSRTIPYSELVSAISSERVSELVINEDGTARANISYENGSSEIVSVVIPSVTALQEDTGGKMAEQMENGSLKQEIVRAKVPWLSLMSIFLPIIAIFVIFFLFFRKGGGGAVNTFTKSRARLATAQNVTFDDVAGAVEEKAELQELVEFLKNPQKFINLGARIPKGVLLVGSPGTGKTLLAKAVAGEAGVPFFSISGSDFVELYVGVGASRVRDLFEQAKKNRPCIIFIDEIDAVGRKRGAGMGGGHDEREQTLNQLLVEMDGFGVNEGVIMIAATNRPDILDPALLRPGRFDRQVVVDLPDVKGREEILKVHSRKKQLSKEVDLEKIAKATVGYSGADLENLMNEAAIFAARRGHDSISERDVEDANVKVMMGAEKRSKIIGEKERKLTAYHEAGHAVMAKILDDTTSIHQVSIIPRGRAGGYTMYLPSEDKTYVSRNEILDRIMILLGGRVAEALVMDDISSGASGDIQHATRIARQMVVRYGMSSRMGPISYDDGDEVFLGRDYGHSKEYSEKIAAEIDEEIRDIINGQYVKTEQLLKENMPVLEAVAQKLLESETIDEDEFNECFHAVYNK